MGRMPETEVSIAGKRFYLHGIPSLYFHIIGILNILMLLSDRLPTILSLEVIVSLGGCILLSFG